MTHRRSRVPLLLFSISTALFITFLAPVCTPPCVAASAAPPALAAQAAAADPSTGAGRQADARGAETSAKEELLPDQYGMSAEYGYTYSPRENLKFVMARVFAIYDYGTVWRMNRPKALRFKVEGAVGSTLTPENDFMASANMLALYYPGKLVGRTFRPYVEAGIGVIYTEYRVKGQGLHFNFNPLLGLGCELPQSNGKNPFAAIRLHHFSNAEIDHDNRGVNSVVLQIGRYF